MKLLLSILMLIGLQAQEIEICTMQVHPCIINQDGESVPADMEPSDSICYQNAKRQCQGLKDYVCQPKIVEEVKVVQDKMTSEVKRLLTENKKLKKQLRLRKRK